MACDFELNRAPSCSFAPLPCFRNGMVQSAISTVRWDVPGALFAWGTPLLIDAGPDETGQAEGPVRLLAYYTAHRTQGPAKGAVILLHGWVGCSHSNYNLVTMRDLIHSGYDVFRLNLRDHGPGYHTHPQALNPGVFLGVLLSETVAAMARCAELVQPLPVYLVGFSMGGNFALRAAMGAMAEQIPNLRKVVAVNPALNPLSSTERIEAHPALRLHFHGPWMEQLRQKQRFFPERYDFRPLADIPSLIDMTNWLVRYLGRFVDAEEYFGAYAVLGRATEGLRVPSRIIATMDDMVVPVADFYGLAPNPLLKIDIHDTGGHVGFLDGLPPRHLIGQIVLEGLEQN